ncbi:MAG: hypothetical protein ABFE02_00045 [Sulfuricella sp.]
MATITKGPNPAHNVGATPWGNTQTLRYTLTTNASGAVEGSNSSAAVGIGDKVRIGVIPAGMSLLDFAMVISDAFTASSTAKLGFEYVDGEDVTAVPQDDDYFVAASTSLASTAVMRKSTTTAPVVLPKPAWLILTNAGAAQAAVGRLDVLLTLGAEGIA